MSKLTAMKTPERAGHTDIFTIPLGAVRLKDLPRVGGKAAHLGEMLATGLPVPSGFVVTTDASERFMQSDPRIEDGLKSLEKCDVQEPAALRAAAEELREKLSTIPVPGDVAEAIATALAEASASAWAVRSSATVEDLPEASFAGQHDSFLNVRGRDAVVAAVKRCWLSLFSERAISYRMRKGVAPGRAQMAVIVQQLILSDAAGVMFTKNPGGGDSDSILIEAAFGLGEAVVQGKVTPDRVEVSRPELQVVRRETGSKGMQIVAGENGVREELLPAGKANAPVLDDETAARLAGLGLKVERLLGGPLDIEWSMHGGEIWLLQARAVTTLQHGQRSTFEDRQVWTNAAAGEVLPDVATPMTWSLLRILIQGLFDELLPACGIHFRGAPLVGLVAGRVYFNVNTVRALGHALAPGAKARNLEHLWGGHQDTLLALKRIKITPADLPQIEVRRWKAVPGLAVIGLRILFYPPKRGQAAVERLWRLNEDLVGINPGSLSDGALLAAIRGKLPPAALKESKLLDEVISVASLFLLYSSLLIKLCERWFGQEGRSIANRLLTGMGDMNDAAAGHELWLLAEQAGRDPEFKSILFSERSFPIFASRLENCLGGQAFLDRWDDFMHRHGHHARGEVELFNPRWSECPDYVLDMVRGYVEAINAGHPGPVVRRDALAAERVALENKCLGSLKNPLKRTLFRFVLHRAQKGGQLRENLKSEGMRLFTFLRRFLLELGQRLAKRGRLADANDIFFLEIEELQSGFLWDAVTDLRAPVAGRRAEYERNSKLTPPAIVVGHFDPDNFQPEAVDHGTKVFHGLGVSAGAATGRAHVILRSDADEHMQPGEILVAPFTDPGWTPYFVAAAGIVMDMGGMLSHGSIVAREYGIPAVVNVGPATQIIRTGQWLEVNADQGVVKVLDAAPETGEQAGNSA
jgi:pyruvate,water dikinase